MLFRSVAGLEAKAARADELAVEIKEVRAEARAAQAEQRGSTAMTVA